MDKKAILVVTITLFWLFTVIACANNSKDNSFSLTESSKSVQDLSRAMEIFDNTLSNYFIGEEMVMARYYNPYTGKVSEEKGSIWMYTSAIESVNAILHSLMLQKEIGISELYDVSFDKYIQVLKKLYNNIDYYLGTFTLTSYTQTAEWSVYGVHRSDVKGKAKVHGIENVYDDQMWLIRELLNSYKITNNKVFLDKAEYLTSYVLDGWDCTFDENGQEIGGITWGSGYVSKHACSNAPIVSPLVWLHEIYSDRDDVISYRYIDASDKKTRKVSEVKKSDYYLEFAKKIYDWQQRHLLRTDGVYDDMMGGCTPRKPDMEKINGKIYRKGIICLDRVGPAFSYNSGTMLSGAADLFRVTNSEKYYEDAVKLSEASFSYFAKKDKEVAGYYSYNVNGFSNWFNGVLLRGFVDVFPIYQNTTNYIETFQQNLDYGYEKHLYKGFLPANLLSGWNNDISKNSLEGMFSFAFASEYALLSQYNLLKKHE